MLLQNSTDQWHFGWIHHHQYTPGQSMGYAPDVLLYSYKNVEIKSFSVLKMLHIAIQILYQISHRVNFLCL